MSHQTKINLYILSGRSWEPPTDEVQRVSGTAQRLGPCDSSMHCTVVSQGGKMFHSKHVAE